MMTAHPVYATIDGPIVMIGFGSIGRGTLPLIERHFKFDRSRLVVIDPSDADRALLDKAGVRFIQQAVTKDNYQSLLGPLLTEGKGQGFCVNLSVDTSSLDLMRYCRELDVLYIDTVVEPWLGFYFDSSKGPESRSQPCGRRAVEPRGMGAIGPCFGRQGHPYCRARHPARQFAKAPPDIRQHMVGRRFYFRRPPACRTRLGHP